MEVRFWRNILITTIVGYIVLSVKDILTPFLIALFIAYLINPFISFIQNKLKLQKRGYAVSIGITITLLISVAIFIISTPIINQEIHKASELLKDYADYIPPIPNELQEQINTFVNSNQIINYINSGAISDYISGITPLLKTLFTESIHLLFSIFNLFLFFLYLIFILKGYPKLSSSWTSWIPIKYRESAQLISNDLNEGMRSYFRGQLLIAIIVGVLFCIGFSIINLPLAILLGVFIGILNLVPYLQIIGLIPAFILSILHSIEMNQNLWVSIGATTLVFVIVQIIQESILIPKIMNKVTGLHPAIILLSLSIWASLLGITGLIIALPITSLLISYYKRFVNNELNQNF